MRLKKEIYNIERWASITFNFKTFEGQINNVPNKPGVYMIFTNASTEIFKCLRDKKIKGAINLKNRVIRANNLPEEVFCAAIRKEITCVYVGHQLNLRRRCKEHFLGNSGTGCLSIFLHSELRNYSWEFRYIDLSNFSEEYNSRLFRTIIENNVKALHGWPILCER